MTTYLIKYIDSDGELCYQDILAETASDAVRQLYTCSVESHTIMDIYVKV